MRYCVVDGPVSRYAKPLARKTVREMYAASRALMDFRTAAAGRPPMPPTAEEIAMAARPVRTRISKPIDPTRVMERDIQASIISFLKVHPKVAYVGRFNSGAMRGSQGQPVYFYRLFLKIAKLVDDLGRDKRQRTEGLSDIGGMLIGGRAFWMETKVPDEDASDAQSEFIECVRKGGGIAGVVRSVGDAETLLEGA